MISNRKRKLLVPALAVVILCVSVVAGIQQSERRFSDFWGSLYDAQSENGQSERARPETLAPSIELGNPSSTALIHWNRIAVDCSGLDHTPVAPGENRVFGEQVGPCRASRAMAIVHIAMFEAMNAIVGGFKGYASPHKSGPGSTDAAIAQAAHDTLIALFPSQKPELDNKLTEDLALIADGQLKANGIAIGKKAADAILALRAADGSQHAEPRVGIDFIPSNEAGKWRQDPISHHPLSLGARWNEVTPFVLVSADQYRAPVPPALNSPEYTAAFNQVKSLGGDGVNTATARTEEQTQIGIYWGYDGTPSLCAPPRLYNQIAVQIAQARGTNGIQLARLLALINTAMADAGIAIWESKYFYQYWRPITGIRESDPGTGPSGTGDGNPDTTGDPDCHPLGAPASNLTGPNFTPPFPAYPSGHAGFGGALFQVLRDFYGTDNIAFTFVSDEFNGVTKDNGGNIRPLIPRSFSSLSQAEEENGQSRIYLGIHWVFDKVQGIAQGRNVGHFVFKRVFQPLPAAKAPVTK
ncbi:MAG TPA: phosphatase PAP2 family protein [Blastocatellia bacterium]|nr:phosphatase PAP2 family protein [Blastocatellia bacterium]